MGSGATVVGNASAATPLGSIGTTDCSGDAPIVAYFSGTDVSHTHADNDCSSPLDVLRTPQRIGGCEEPDQHGRAQRLSFTLPRFSISASCPDEAEDCDSMDFNRANHSPPLIMMSRPHPESVSLSRPLVLRY